MTRLADALRTFSIFMLILSYCGIIFPIKRGEWRIAYMTIDSITYVMATVEDAELLARSRVEFFTDIYKDLTDMQKRGLYEANLAYFQEALADGTFTAYLAYDGETLAATSGVNFYTTPPNQKNITGKTAYISNMYTKPEYRARGIATRLFDMTAAEAKKRGCGKALLVATSMGRPIYAKYGFTDPVNVMEYYF